jgi:hypothetical protein
MGIADAGKLSDAALSAINPIRASFMGSSSSALRRSLQDQVGSNTHGSNSTCQTATRCLRPACRLR